MAGFEFSPEEDEAISKLAVADEWERDVLERRIRHKIMDGCSFSRAIMRVLVEAERPDDNVKPESDTKSLIELVEQRKAAAAIRWAERMKK